MTPTTRSSAPSTPIRATGSGGLPTPNTTPRRAPHCKQCHRPRAGHPRSGCPYVDASDPPSPSTSTPAFRSTSASVPVLPASADDDGITEDLSSLHIVNPDEEHERKAQLNGKKLQRRLSVRFALVPEQTLESLCTTDSQLVQRLLQPGMMSDTINDDADDYGSLLEWRKTLVDAEPPLDAPQKVKGDGEQKLPSVTSGSGSLSHRMPGTLVTPTASLTSTEPLSNQSIGGSVDMNKTIFLLPDPATKKPKPLVRSMSMEQRSVFLDSLERFIGSPGTAQATLILLTAADAEGVFEDAQRVGFIVRVLPHGGEEDRKWVALGTDERAVHLLSEKFAEEEQKNKMAKGRGRFRAAAGGALIGAVATWTGLAFS
ncbi:hypothetical protein F5I97DRAFT_828631 [Phlebopus sp. FC_14]|nr:hypothetical protein F5I97DRAFT_828631 [Phlebopus sp. FC_14]